MDITSTYRVVGRLSKRAPNQDHYDEWEELDDGVYYYRDIDEQVETTAPWVAIASFEVDGWEFDTVSVTLISEAEKMRLAGQPSLLDLITN